MKIGSKKEDEKEKTINKKAKNSEKISDFSYFL